MTLEIIQCEECSKGILKYNSELKVLVCDTCGSTYHDISEFDDLLPPVKKNE
jgi:Zn finger protein HypA/HybF involved in hydrogenase expression